MSTNSIAKKFVYLSLIFGILFMVLTPPFQAPDEDSHFKKAYVLAKGNLFPEVENGKIGYMLPKGMVDYISRQNNKAGKLDNKFTYKDMYLTERLPGDYGEQKFYGFSTARVSPVGHIVPAVGIAFGNIIANVLDVESPSVLYLLYFARFFNLLFYVSIIAISISITPILKRTMAMIGVMPMSLFLAATVSYDPLLISLAFLASAMIFQLSFDEKHKKLTISQIVILSLIAYVFIVIKIVYIPIFLLLLVLPKYELTNKKVYLKKLLSIGIIIAVLYIVTKLIMPTINTDEVTEEAKLISQQMQFVIHNPIKYLGIFFHTLSKSRMFLISTTIGTFGLIDTNLYCVFLGTYLLIMPIIGIAEISLNNVKIRKIDRLTTFVSFAATIFGCFLAMYIYWTSVLENYGVAAGEITGVQGRYFIPIIPLIFLFFANTKLQKIEKLNKIMRVIVDNFTLLSIIMLCASVVAMLLRFWC